MLELVLLTGFLGLQVSTRWVIQVVRALVDIILFKQFQTLLVSFYA